MGQLRVQVLAEEAGNLSLIRKLVPSVGILQVAVPTPEGAETQPAPWEPETLDSQYVRGFVGVARLVEGVIWGSGAAEKRMDLCAVALRDSKSDPTGLFVDGKTCRLVVDSSTYRVLGLDGVRREENMHEITIQSSDGRKARILSCLGPDRMDDIEIAAAGSTDVVAALGAFTTMSASSASSIRENTEILRASDDNKTFLPTFNYLDALFGGTAMPPCDSDGPGTVVVRRLESPVLAHALVSRAISYAYTTVQAKKAPWIAIAVVASDHYPFQRQGLILLIFASATLLFEAS